MACSAPCRQADWLQIAGAGLASLDAGGPAPPGRRRPPAHPRARPGVSSVLPMPTSDTSIPKVGPLGGAAGTASGHRSLHAALRLLLMVLSAATGRLSGQAVAGGRVVRTSGADSIPVAGARVLLHRIGRSVQGPIDSAFADRRGAFRFRFVPDTSAVYLTSSRYDGIEYFSPTVHLDPAAPDTALRIV